MALTEEKAAEMKRILDLKAVADADYNEAQRLSAHDVLLIERLEAAKENGKTVINIYNTGNSAVYKYEFSDDGTLAKAITFAVTETLTEVAAIRAQLDIDFDNITT